MGNVSGNATAGDAEQTVLNATLLAIAVIGLALPFVNAGWRRFRQIDGKQMSLLGKQVVLSTGAVMLVAFMGSLLTGRPPEPETEFNPSFLSFMFIILGAWSALWFIWYLRYVFFDIWRWSMKVGIKRRSSLSIKELEEKGKELGVKAPSLVAWCGCCGMLVVAMACGILALVWLSMGAVGLKYSGPTLEWGTWLSWSAVLVFAVGVMFFGLGYTMDVLDMRPFGKGRKKGGDEQVR